RMWSGMFRPRVLILLVRGGGVDLAGGPDRGRRLRRDPGSAGASGSGGLAAKPEPCDDGPVARVVLLDQVREKATALAHELEEAAAGVVVLWKLPEVIREALDAFRQERHLDLRGAGVAILRGV